MRQTKDIFTFVFVAVFCTGCLNINTDTKEQVSQEDAIVPLDCNVTDLTEALPLELEVDTSNETDDFTSSCSKGETSGAADVAWRWRAPADGYYSFNTEGSLFDTVVTIYEANCDAVELRCNDDIVSGVTTSRLRLEMNQDEEILIVVDAYEPGVTGSARLLISQAEMVCEDGIDGDDDGKADCDDSDCSDAPNCSGLICPETTLAPEIPISYQGETSGNDVLVSNSECSEDGADAPQATFSFKAPMAGQFRISTEGSEFDTILYVRESSCTGPELACNDDHGEGKTSFVELELETNDIIVIVVDGWDNEQGAYQLTIEGVEALCADGIDNDNDGFADCDDPDCLSVECAMGGAWPEEWAEREELMLLEVNLRREAGAMCADDYYPPVPALEMNSHLRLSARLHSFDMGQQNYFEHEALDGRTPTQRMLDAGFTGDYPTGENISGGYATAEESVEGLMNSPGHCRNIMDPDFAVIGLGYSYNDTSDLGHYWAQNFGGSH